ncbi:MAG: glycosyltransferase family 4 protein, partial [Candidatus Jacksonbacteria bacterium]|nr:glycosyltransferase family 4 protein [Candidatus Jacksonbacteria bacterium]
MKTVAFDITPLLEKNWGGVSWYSFYLSRGLVDYAARGNARVVLFYNQRKLLPDKIAALLKKWRLAPNVYVAGYRIPNKFLNLSMRFLKFPHMDELISLKHGLSFPRMRESKQEVKKNPDQIPAFAGMTKSADYFLIPNLSFITLSKDTPYVAVCHDLSCEIFPEFFTMRQRLWHRLINPRRFYQNAHRVIAVSENTKQDLVDLYAIDPKRITISYPGIDRALFYPQKDMRDAREKYGLPENFILSVGTLEPRKNYETLLEAFDMLCGSEVHLLIVGSEGWKFDRIYRFWNRMKRKSQVRFLFNVTREDLPALYSAARLFIYPSFYEGFGFPPLEAAACGAPVIVSHGSSLPEIMGDAALYVDPFNIADLARA